MCASPAIGKSRSPCLTFGAAKKGAQMEARQEVRLKEAEAADQKKRLTETDSLNQPQALSANDRQKSIQIRAHLCESAELTTLAEGLIYRSLGQRPRNPYRRCRVWLKATITRFTHTNMNMTFGQ